MDSEQVRKMLKKVDDDEKNKCDVERNNNTVTKRTKVAWFLTEDGLYEVLMQSRKPIANG